MPSHDARIIRGAAIPTAVAGLIAAVIAAAVVGTKGLIGAVFATLLVMAFFMRLRRGPPLLRIAAAVGFAWLAVLIGMTVADVLTRVVLPSPW